MYCPNCKQEYDGKFCPECGTRLIEKPATSGVSLSLGDANAISGGLHVNDSHAVHNEDKSVHNITNATSTVNNITQMSVQKTEIELVQERKAQYLSACKRAYEDNVLEQSEVIELEELRIKIGLDKATADEILDKVRVMSDRNARKSTLNPMVKTKLKILTENLQKNDVRALMDQIDSLEPLIRKFDHDELSRKYYLVLAALKPEKCIKQKERTKTDTYWESFWSYLAYIKEGRLIDAEETLASLDHFSSYPEDNMTVLAAAGELMMGHADEAKEYLDAATGEYTSALQRFVDSLFLLLAPEMAEEMGADEDACVFYLVNFFGKKDPKAQAEEERRKAEEAKRKADAERLRKEREEFERKKRAEEERLRKEREEIERRRAEEERRKAEEAKRKADAERLRKEREEFERKKRAEEGRRKAEEAKRKADAECLKKEKEEAERKKKAEEERLRKEREEIERRRAEEERRKAEETNRKTEEAEESESDESVDIPVSQLILTWGLPILMVFGTWIFSLFTDSVEGFGSYLFVFLFVAIGTNFMAAKDEDHELVKGQRKYFVIPLIVLILISGICIWLYVRSIMNQPETKTTYTYINDKLLVKNVFIVKINDGDTLLTLKNQGLCELVDGNLHERIKPQYDSIGYFAPSVKDEPMFIVRQNGKYGLVDKKGKELVEPKYDKIGNADNEEVTFKGERIFKAYVNNEIHWYTYEPQYLGTEQ